MTSRSSRKIAFGESRSWTYATAFGVTRTHSTMSFPLASVRTASSNPSVSAASAASADAPARDGNNPAIFPERNSRCSPGSAIPRFRASRTNSVRFSASAGAGRAGKGIRSGSAARGAAAVSIPSLRRPLFRCEPPVL